MRFIVKVYLDGVLDNTHPSTGEYDNITQAIGAIVIASSQPAVSKVTLTKKRS